MKRSGRVEFGEHRVQYCQRMKRDGDGDGAGPDLLADCGAALCCALGGSWPIHGRRGAPGEDPEQLPPFVGSFRVHRRSGPRVIGPGGSSLELSRSRHAGNKARDWPKSSSCCAEGQQQPARDLPHSAPPPRPRCSARGGDARTGVRRASVPRGSARRTCAPCPSLPRVRGRRSRAFRLRKALHRAASEVQFAPRLPVGGARLLVEQRDCAREVAAPKGAARG